MKQFFLFIFLLTSSHKLMAQDSYTKKPDSLKPFKVAVFAPLYLDSAFDGNNYSINTKNIPAYIIPGLDFYNGVSLAIDSLEKEKINIQVQIIDTKSTTKTFKSIVESGDIYADLFIASFNDRNEMSLLANYAWANKIPLISSTYPNAAGVKDNAYFVLLNPTLPTQLEGITNYVQKNHSLDKIVYFKRSGNNEDNQIKSLFDQFNARGGKLAVKPVIVDLPTAITKDNIITKLDSTKQNFIIGGSLNDVFASKLVKALSTLPAKYKYKIIGMPTWDGVKFNADNVPVIYSTPYNFQRTDKTVLRIAALYKAKINGKANDMVFKGFESMYHFTKLYAKYRSGFLEQVSSKDFKLFSEFDIQPASVYKNTYVDYLENRKLYFIQKQNGVTTLLKN